MSVENYSIKYPYMMNDHMLYYNTTKKTTFSYPQFGKRCYLNIWCKILLNFKEYSVSTYCKKYITWILRKLNIRKYTPTEPKLNIMTSSIGKSVPKQQRKRIWKSFVYLWTICSGTLKIWWKFVYFSWPQKNICVH